MISIIALIIIIIAKIWLLVEAFSEHFLWGLACLLLPIADVVFLILHFDRAWRPVGLGLIGYALGTWIGGGLPYLHG